ncbi:MAG: ATP phosphoribosyltransferase regulatory subunit, partial [Chloroflexaceae bacterium]|nr:ATP phosphoribosyltransferase regulatory subunit [Chloroflexaceae bacterium]
MHTPIDTVRGMHDVLPDEYRAVQQVRRQLVGLIEHYGYEFLDLPIVEYRDLYLRKLGEELVGKVYEFDAGGRELALRPEWTASVLRAYVAHMQDQPLPLRLAYSGPVFRYERPQRLTYRQFTQFGVEMIGGTVPRADAEVLALACAGLAAAGISGYRVLVGHIGLVRQMLAPLGLEERTLGVLIWNLDRMREQGVEAVRERLHELRDETPIDPTLLEGLDDEQATRLLLHTMDEIRVSLSLGTRPPEEIVQRLVRKLRRGDPQPRIERALVLLERLCQIRGTPAEALPRLTALLEEADLYTPALDEVRTLLPLFTAHGVPQERVQIDFGLGRGLQYYTGLIFEIYDQHGYQLCGGGRYDDLVTALGGRQSTPAVGFSYGLERVAAASNGAATLPQERGVLVVPVDDADYPYALEVAQRARSAGMIAMVDVRGRG